MTGATYGAAALAVLPLAAILGMLVMKGAGSLDWNFFTKSSVPLGESGGGFAYAIVGTLIIVGLACAIGIPVGVGAGVYLAEFPGGGALACILVPIVARTTEEMVRLVPNSLREAALALGYPRWRTSLQVVVRTARAGIVAGCR